MAMRAAGHIGAALAVIASQHVGRADIEVFAPRVGDDFGEGGAVAEAEIKALRADRRHHMRGFADQRDAPARACIRGFDRERKHAAAPSTVIAPRSEWARRSISAESAASG